jgi:hypothetical protein
MAAPESRKERRRPPQRVGGQGRRRRLPRSPIRKREAWPGHPDYPKASQPPEKPQGKEAQEAHHPGHLVLGQLAHEEVREVLHHHPPLRPESPEEEGLAQPAQEGQEEEGNQGVARGTEESLKQPHSRHLKATRRL